MAGWLLGAFSATVASGGSLDDVARPLRTSPDTVACLVRVSLRGADKREGSRLENVLNDPGICMRPSEVESAI